jgi:hypothetical protein
MRPAFWRSGMRAASPAPSSARKRSLSSSEVSLSLLHQRLVWPAALPETERALR